MRIVKPSATITDLLNGEEIIKKIETCGRVCYQSEWKTDWDSNPEATEKFIRRLVAKRHGSVIEHFSFTVNFIVDRGISHEIVRHRIASYSQESTRFCNYRNEEFGNEITVIEPFFLLPGTNGYRVWKESCEAAEKAYFGLLAWGCSPQEARSVLPNSLKTQLVMTSNLWEWRHFFQVRTAPDAHPQMREVVKPLLEEVKTKIPIIFDDIS